MWAVVNMKPTIDHAVAHSVMCSLLLACGALAVLDSTTSPVLPEFLRPLRCFRELVLRVARCCCLRARRSVLLPAELHRRICQRI